MKQLHRHDLFAWSVFDEERNIDFHSVLWVREDGNVLIDPLPLSAHDYQHLQSLGGVSTLVMTNSDHLRAAEWVANQTGAILCAPASEQASFPLVCQRWISDGEEIVSGLMAYQLEGSKTPGELALILDGTTLITGDLIRCHVAGVLCLLPEKKLTDKAKAIASVKRMAGFLEIETVLVGDGWPLFNTGGAALRKLVQLLEF
jgi:Metallo-beta-lactamase superfamily